MTEHSIMNDGIFLTKEHCYRYYSERLYGTVRHEIFFGTANRKKSIKYGLVVFIRPEDHNMSEYGVHNRKGHEFDMYLKSALYTVLRHVLPFFLKDGKSSYSGCSARSRITPARSIIFSCAYRSASNFESNLIPSINVFLL